MSKTPLVLLPKNPRSHHGIEKVIELPLAPSKQTLSFGI